MTPSVLWTLTWRHIFNEIIGPDGLMSGKVRKYIFLLLQMIGVLSDNRLSTPTK